LLSACTEPLLRDMVYRVNDSENSTNRTKWRQQSTILKRKITLRTQEFLKMHKDAYKAALEVE